MEKRKQLSIILEALEAGLQLTAKDAMQVGIFRLAARIHDLRKQGHSIQSNRLRTANGSCSVYSLTPVSVP